MFEKLKNKKVIVRSYNEGVNAGIVVKASKNGVIIKKGRRLWKHAPKDKNMSWYEGVAVSGISDDSSVSPTFKEKIIVEKYSLTLCTDEAYKSIMDLEPHKQG